MIQRTAIAKRVILIPPDLHTPSGSNFSKTNQRAVREGVVAGLLYHGFIGTRSATTFAR